MGLETCLHLSTMFTTARAGVVCLDTAVSPKEKLMNFPTSRGFRMSSSFFSPPPPTPSPSLSLSLILNPSVHTRYGRKSIVCKAQGAVNEVVAVTDSSWKDLVVGSERPVLVEFWAPWCGPCRMIAPVINELAKEYAGKIVCYKLNTDDCPTIATEYGIRSIPTVLVFKNGEKKESVIGAVPKSTLTATIEKYIEA